MPGTVLDTNVISEAMREKPNAKALHWFSQQEADALFLTSITLAELWHGVERLASSHVKRDGLVTKLEILEQQFAERILSFDLAAARMWGRLKARHGSKGRVFPDIDLQIAAIVLEHEMSLATANTKDFDGLDMNLINPFA
jgi:predicted nucleic acid-binding protein